MELFKIREGPWKKLFEGIFQEYEIALYSNPDSVLMVLILEKEKEKIIGTVLELYKIFYSDGESEQFISTLPRNVILIHKHQETVNQKFMLLASKPNYVNWNEKDFQEETDEQLKKLSVSTKMIKEIAKAYDLELIEMHNASNEIKKAFFSEPLMVPITVTPTKIKEKNIESETKIKEILLGKTREGNKIEEPIQLINNSIISGGTKTERKTVMQILIEGMLLNKIPAIIFDYENSFSGLGTPNNYSELKEFNQEPIGFPVKKFIPGENLFIELKLFEPQGFTEFIGTGDKKPAQIISSLIELNEFNSIKELIDSIKRKTPDENSSEYEIHKAKRILQTLDFHYNKLLSQKNSFEELIKIPIKGIGKASLLEMDSLKEKEKFLSTYSVIKLIFESIKKEGKTNQTKTILVLPEAQKIIPKENRNLLQEELIDILKELPEYGCGIMLEVQTSNELDKKTIDYITSTFTVIQGKDIGVQLKNRKSYRAIIKPGLSKI
jgi:ribosomal protein L28